MQYLIKIIITAILVTGVSELAKRFSSFAAVMAALPLTSILAFIWLYRDTKDKEKVIELSYGIFWMVMPSLLFFLILPFLLKKGMGFPLSMILSCFTMVIVYFAYTFILGKLGIKFN